MAVEANMKTVLNAVSFALQQDGSNNNKAAYISYLQCIQQVAHLLLQDAASPAGIRVGVSTKKCVQLGRQCMERIVELVDSLQEACPTGPLSPQRGKHGHEAPVRPTSESSQSMPSSFQLPELQSPTQSLQTYMRRSAEPSPIEIAQKKNQQLMLAYRKRMSHISSKSQNATNISLSLQRRMAENMAIARSREDALAKKVQERQQRLEEEAARRFTYTAGMSKEEQERRHIYSQVFIYEADAKYLQLWREKLSANPEDAKLVQDLILLIINTKDHPLAQLLNKIQYTIYDKLRPLVLSYIHELNRITVPYIPSPDREQPGGIQTVGEPSSDSPSAPVVCEGRSSSQQTSNLTSGTGHWTSSTPTDTDKTFEGTCTQNKIDLERALNQNSHLSKSLQAETRRSDEVLKNLSDVDQFDDLFDDVTGDLNSVAPATENPPVIEIAEKAADIDLLKDLANITDKDRIDNLKMDALDKHMAYIASDVREGMDKLSAMFIIAYEDLDSAAGRDLCLSSLEGPFFKPLWPYLLALFRLGSYHEEVKAAKAMTRLAKITPGDLGVKKHFCPPTSCPGMPFQSCIDELTRIGQLISPLLKLESIVRLCKLLCKIMEENSTITQSGSTQAQQSTGADDLIPVLSYVVIHSRLPQLVAECHAMEEFIHEGYLMGEEGYCLTSLQTSLNYVISIADGNTVHSDEKL